MADIYSPNPLGARLLTDQMDQAKRPSHSSKVKNSEFAKILTKANSTLEVKKTAAIKTPSPLAKTNSSKDNIVTNPQDGTKIADEQLKEYARNMEQHYMASMWQFAYRVGKEPGESGIGEALYSGGFIKEMTAQAYGEEGGPMAEAIYENLKTAYKVK